MIFFTLHTDHQHVIIVHCTQRTYMLKLFAAHCALTWTSSTLHTAHYRETFAHFKNTHSTLHTFTLLTSTTFPVAPSLHFSQAPQHHCTVTAQNCTVTAHHCSAVNCTALSQRCTAPYHCFVLYLTGPHCTTLQYSPVPGLFIAVTAAKTMDRTFLTPGGGLDFQMCQLLLPNDPVYMTEYMGKFADLKKNGF